MPAFLQRKSKGNKSEVPTKRSQSRGLFFLTWTQGMGYKFQRKTVGLTLGNSQKKWAPEVLCPNKVPKRTIFSHFLGTRRRKTSSSCLVWVQPARDCQNPANENPLFSELSFPPRDSYYSPPSFSSPLYTSPLLVGEGTCGARHGYGPKLPCFADSE